MAIMKCGRCECYEECDLLVVKGVMENLKKYDATELVTVKEVVNGKIPNCYAQGDENSAKSTYKSLGKSDDEFLEESVDEVLGKSVDKALLKSTNKMLEKSNDKPLGKSVDGAMGKSVDAALEKSAGELLVKSIVKVLGKSVDEALDKSANEPLGKSDDNPWLKTINEPLGKSVVKALGITVDASKDETLGKSTKACNKRAVEEKDVVVDNKRSCAGKTLRQLLEEGQSLDVLEIAFYFPRCDGECEAATCGHCYAKHKPKESMKAARRKKRQSLRKGIVNMYL